jgi:hypothetical protein
MGKFEVEIKLFLYLKFNLIDDKIIREFSQTFGNLL